VNVDRICFVYRVFQKELYNFESMATPFPGSYSPGFFSYGDSLKIECSYHLCLQMLLNSELELLPQLQK